jgi:uncharacterized protein YbjQ (UPF0145 family)
MNCKIKFVVAATLSLCVSTAFARTEVDNFSIADALAQEQASYVLGEDIKFYFGAQVHAGVAVTFSEYSTSQQANGAIKSNKDACNAAFLLAMKSMRDEAKKVGANAVVNIRSNYEDNASSSTETFRCGSSTLKSNVALVGDVVTLK